MQYSHMKFSKTVALVLWQHSILIWVSVIPASGSHALMSAGLRQAVSHLAACGNDLSRAAGWM